MVDHEHLVLHADARLVRRARRRREARDEVRVVPARHGRREPHEDAKVEATLARKERRAFQRRERVVAELRDVHGLRAAASDGRVDDRGAVANLFDGPACRVEHRHALEVFAEHLAGKTTGTGGTSRAPPVARPGTARRTSSYARRSGDGSRAGCTRRAAGHRVSALPGSGRPTRARRATGRKGAGATSNGPATA